MKQIFNMKRITATLLVAGSVLLLPACNSSRLRDIDKQLDDLEQEDQRILKELGDAIDELEKALLAKIEASNRKLDGDIDAAMLDMYTLLHEKMTENQAYLESEVDARKQECDKTITKLYARSENTVKALDAALDKSHADLQEAIKKGDKETEEKLRNLQDMIDDTRVFVEKVDKEITSYEGKADLLKATGMFKDGAVEKLKTVLKDCSEFDLQRHIDRAGEELAWMSKIKLEELTKDRVEEVKHILELMNNLVDDATQMVDESQSKTEEMSSFVDDWSSRADEYYSSLDDYSTAILDGYDEVLSVYSLYEPEVDSWWSDLETAYSQMESDYSSMLSLESELADGSDAITDGYDELIHTFYDYFDHCIDIEDEAQASYEVLESWVDSYGDLIRRYM